MMILIRSLRLKLPKVLMMFNDLYYPEPYASGMGLPGPVDNSIYILKEVTADMMNIAVGINSWPDYAHLPSLLLHLTLGT